MNDSITIRGIVATDPRHLVTGNGLAITSLRVASQSRRWDRSTSSWANGDTNWFTVTAFRSLASNLHKSITKGDRVIVTGRLRVRNWEREDRSGMSVEIDADAVGHDLAWGRGTWIRVPRQTADETAVPGDARSQAERAAAAEVGTVEDSPPASADGPDSPTGVPGQWVDGQGVVHEPEPTMDDPGPAVPGVGLP